MSGGDRPRLSLEERLELAARSRASSPEAAIRLVQRLSRLGTENLFCSRANLNARYGLIGEAMDDPDMGVEYYSGFCRCIQLTILRADGMPGQPAPESEFDPYRPIWGTRFNNAIVLLGLMLLDHGKNRMKRKDIYHCTRMTLWQYCTALEEISFRRDGKVDWQRRSWMDLFRNCYDDAVPLTEALESILRDYIAAWRTFGRIDRILAGEYPVDVPDPGVGDAPRAVHGQVFLRAQSYSSGTLRALAAELPSPELRALLEENICGDRLASAMQEVNVAVSKLFLLWVEPYLRF